MKYNYDFEAYEQYEDAFDPIKTDRKARRKRKPVVNPNDRKKQLHRADKVAETIGLEGGFNTTYQPSRHEEGWLLQSLQDFYNKELISDVNAVIKGGKEANVYRCTAHPQTGMEWVAAKVYRPRMFRNLRNDKMYRQGRLVLGESGRPIDPKDKRIRKALAKKSAFGGSLEHASWLMHEYTTLERLYALGAAVPKPIASSSNAILMGYVGDENIPAPTLNEIALDKAEAQHLYQIVFQNVEMMLKDGRIHGDLSAYNILYWQGEITFIDFPQVANARISRNTHAYGSQINPDAEFILERDITRVCEYFQKQGIHCDPRRIMDKLWYTYVAPNPEDVLAEVSRYEPEGI